LVKLRWNTSSRLDIIRFPCIK